MAEPKIRVRFYRFQNRLREKTAGLGGGDSAIAAEAVARADAALREMEEDYPDWVAGLVTQLDDFHRRCLDAPGERRRLFENIHRIAHDMKGQGGTFGYPLITIIADSLYGFSGTSGRMADQQVAIIKAHIDSMRVVIRDRIRGDGGELGKELINALQIAIEKHPQK